MSIKLKDNLVLSEDFKNMMRGAKVFIREVSDWNDFETKERLGTRVTLQFDRSDENYPNDIIDVFVVDMMDESVVNRDVIVYDIYPKSIYGKTRANSTFASVEVTLMAEIEVKL